MLNENKSDGAQTRLPSIAEVFVSHELDPDVCEAMERFTLEQIEEKQPSREWVEEYLDAVYPVMYGTCGNCSRSDSLCRVIHITPGDAEKLILPTFDLLCDDCFAAMRDINSARVCNDINGLSEATKRFTARSGLFRAAD